MKQRIYLLIALLVVSLFSGLATLRPAVANAAGANLIANPSAETIQSGSTDPVGWTHSGWGANTASFAVRTSGQSGTRSLSVTVSGYTDGDAKWYFTPVAVTPGQSYVFTDYYKATSTSELVADYLDANGVHQYQWLGTLPSSTAWKQAGYTLTAPASAQRLTVLHLLASSGTLQTDSYSLTTPTTPVVTAGVPNASMEQVSDLNATQPLAWRAASWGNNVASFAYATAGYDGTRSLRTTISSYVDGDAKWYFDPVPVTPSARYVYADYYKSGVATNLVAQYELADGSTAYQSLGTLVRSLAWKRGVVGFTTPANARTITILHTLASMGTLTIDLASLQPDTVLTVTSGVPNSSLEQTSLTDPVTPLGWTTSKWGSNTTTFSYLATGHTGGHAVQTNTTSYTSGDAKWYYAEQPVLAGQSYSFSDWYQSSVTSEVVVWVTNTDGSTQYLHLPTANASASWTQYRAKVTLPSTAQTATVMHLIAGVGFLVTDDYSFLPTTTIGFSRALVSLTFDDGWQSIYSNALPLLDSYGYKSTQYLISGLIDTPSYMTTAMLQNLYAQGHEVGSHTVTHPNLTTVSGAQLVAELRDSQAYFLAHGLAPVASFATPYGAYNATVLSEIQMYYSSHRSTDVGYNSRDSFDRYNLKVQDVSLSTTGAELQSWLDQATADKTWLILVFHQIDQSGSAYSSTPTQLADYLARIANRNLAVVTISQGLSETLPQL